MYPCYISGNILPASVCKGIQSFPPGFLFSHWPGETKYRLGQFSSVFYFSLWWAPLCVEFLLGYQFTGVVRCCIPIIYRIYLYIYNIYYCTVYSETCIIKPSTYRCELWRIKGLQQKREKFAKFVSLRKEAILSVPYEVYSISSMFYSKKIRD